MASAAGACKRYTVIAFFLATLLPVSVCLEEEDACDMSLLQVGLGVETEEAAASVSVSAVGGGKPELVATFSEATGCIWSVAFSPDGNRLATGSCDGKLRVYAQDRADPLVATLTDARKDVGSVAFWRHKEGPLLLLAGSLDKHWRLYNATGEDTPNLLKAKQEKGWEVDGVAFSADSPIFSVACAGANTSLYSIINPSEPELIGEVDSERRMATTTAIIPHGARMAIGYMDGTLKVIGTTMDGLQPLDSKSLSGIINVAYSPDNRLLAVASVNGIASIFDNVLDDDLKDQGKPMRLLAKIDDAGDGLNAVAFSPDNKFLATGSWDNRTRIYDVTKPAAPRLLATLSEALGKIYSVAFAQHPTFYFLATGSQDGKTRLYRIPRD